MVEFYTDPAQVEPKRIDSSGPVYNDLIALAAEFYEASACLDATLVPSTERSLSALVENMTVAATCRRSDSPSSAPTPCGRPRPLRHGVLRQLLRGELDDYEYPEVDIAESLPHLPKVGYGTKGRSRIQKQNAFRVPMAAGRRFSGAFLVATIDPERSVVAMFVPLHPRPGIVRGFSILDAMLPMASFPPSGAVWSPHCVGEASN